MLMNIKKYTIICGTDVCGNGCNWFIPDNMNDKHRYWKRRHDMQVHLLGYIDNPERTSTFPQCKTKEDAIKLADYFNGEYTELTIDNCLKALNTLKNLM